MRTVLEDREIKFLSNFASKSKYSKGRQYQEEESENRTCFQRDCDRIVHSKAFRRLKHKTQVFLALESDHYRSRLIHSIEVSHISRHIARLLGLNEDLCEAISLAHDLGHTPFGHAGEKELNEIMSDFGGFEHNRQSRRIVDELEIKYPNFKGLNLTFEVREGLIKHITPWDKPETKNSVVTLEAQVVNLADEIAYNNHDLDDGIRANIIQEDDLEKSVNLWNEAKKVINSKYTNISREQSIPLINSYLISTQIRDVVEETMRKIKLLNINNLDDIQNNIAGFSAEMKEKNTQLRKFLFENFYMSHDIYRKVRHGQLIINKLFSAYINDIKLLPVHFQKYISDSNCRERVICDYIAGMTDVFAQKEYRAIYGDSVLVV